MTGLTIRGVGGLMAKKTLDIVSLCGIGNLRRKVILRLDGSEPEKPATKRIYGMMGLTDKFRMDELKTVWGDFLKGEEILLSHNQLVVRTFKHIVSDRDEAKELALELTTPGNPYIALSDRLDDMLKIKSAVVEDSVRVSYLKIEKVRNPCKARVLMKVNFALKIKLVEPIPDVEETMLRIPCSVSNKKVFYRMIKVCFENPSRVCFNHEHGYFAPPCRTEEETNSRFALDLALRHDLLDHFGNPCMDLLSFADLWSNLESDGERKTFYPLKIEPFPKVQLCFDRYYSRGPLLADDLDKTIKSLQKQSEEQNGWRFGFEGCSVGGLQVRVSGPRPDIQEHSAELCALTIKHLMNLLDLHYKAILWNESCKTRWTMRFNSYEKYLANYWIEKVRTDPLTYTEHSCDAVKNLAQSLVSGVPYGS